MRHFRYFLQVHNFIMFTDNQPLVKALHKQLDPWSTLQQRHLSHVDTVSGYLVRHQKFRDPTEHRWNLFESLLGGLLTSLAILDRTTRWPEVCPYVHDITAASCARAFMARSHILASDL